jgi:hypothetical protein
MFFCGVLNMKNGNRNKKSDSYEKRSRPFIIACRLTIKEYEDFREWKNNSNIENNSIALRLALTIAIKEGL